jgi:hypothetical protein
VREIENRLRSELGEEHQLKDARTLTKLNLDKYYLNPSSLSRLKNAFFEHKKIGGHMRPKMHVEKHEFNQTKFKAFKSRNFDHPMPKPVRLQKTLIN